MSTSTEFYRAMDIPSIQKSFSYHLKYSLSLNPDEATQKDYFHALCLTIRDRLVERWIETQELYREQKVKQTYYLSMEYLMGRSLGNNILNLEIWDLCKQALAGLNISLEKILDVEVDAGLGNGGLGRLAACFLDSLTTLGLPAIGYGLRYEYGIFRQEIVKGEQKEEPDPWLRHGHYFEVQRPQESYPVHFGGHVQLISHGNRYHFEWIPATTVIAVPFDVPIIGYKQDNVNTLRLWSALSSHEFDLEDFNEGDYIAAVKSKIQAENLTKVLYPNDNNHSGKELRFRQQYFFVAASIYDIFIHFRRISSDIYELPQKVAIQLNDTHPSLAVAEFMRILLDEWNLTWEKSWEITTQVFGYTNHTLLPEALEEWPVSFFKELLPRHLQIIEEINRRFLEEVAISAPGDRTKLEEMSLINTQREEPHVRMAYLATVASHKINGVSKLHTELLKNKVLKDFATLYPQRFLAITNGITQ
ncbi:MAG: glycogen/starch/alpha-glucan family phosphorylase, partial [Planctomycetota bacterium]